MPLIRPFDPEPEGKPDPKWLVYQKAVAQLKESFGDCEVLHDHRVMGRRSGIERQVDIWLSATVGGKHVVTVAVECKCFEASPVQIKEVDAFYGFLDDVGANKGVLISNTGFTDGAKRRADSSMLELQTLTLEEAEEFDWADFIDVGAVVCMSHNDCQNVVRMSLSDGEGSSAGLCDDCDSLHISCGECGKIAMYDEEEFIKCAGCKNHWWFLRVEENEVTELSIRRIDVDAAEGD